MGIKIILLFVLYFFYNIIEGKVITANTCEGHSMNLHCSYGKMIRILRADYGRWNESVCPYFDDPNMRLDCHSEYAQTILSATCDGHQNCKMMINNENFMDPCPGQVKYAEAVYICVPKPKKNYSPSSDSRINFGTSSNDPGDELINKGVRALFETIKNKE